MSKSILQQWCLNKLFFKSRDTPVMCCHPAKRDANTTGEGPAPSTPRHKGRETRRMSVKKFFRCTPEDGAVIATNAAKAGLEEASYLRVQALSKSRVKACRRIRADWDELRRCMGAINKAGNVVNQLVVELRCLGRGADKADTALTELVMAARSITRILKNL